MLPNVKITIAEEVNFQNTAANSFLPLAIVKTKTGPIGTEVLVKSEKSFNDTFGTPDASTPEAFGLAQYIKNYGSAYVVRVASASAAKGTATVKASNVNLFTVETKYKTDDLNGVEVSLVYDSTNTKVYITTTVGSKVITSIKETLNYATATAVDLETALDKLVSSYNDAQNYFILENVFTDKTTEDEKPASLEGASATVTGGINGNSGVADADVTALIENYRKTDIGIDAILAPGFESVEVVTKLANVAHDSSFMALASITGSTALSIAATANTYPENESLALYADKVCLQENPEIEVPACIGILPAYATRVKSSKWLAPAGVTRGTLTDVYALAHNFNDAELEDLYTNSKPVNGIKKIAGRGYIVWGQKTTSQDTQEYQDRINVVRLVKYLTKEVYKVSYDYLFEPITDYTYNAWTLQVSAILDDIKNGNGLSEYRVIMDDTLNTEETKRQNKLIGVVRLKPLEAAEFIEINFVITDDVEGGNA